MFRKMCCKSGFYCVYEKDSSRYTEVKKELKDKRLHTNNGGNHGI